MRLDGNRVLATIFGYQEGRPRDIDTAEKWMAFARVASKPDVAHFLENAKPVWSKPRTFIYDKVSKRKFAFIPANVIVLGDAACSTDPAFAQGMTKAAIQAVQVRRAFETKGHCVQADFEWVADMPHLIGCVEAFRFSKTTGFGPPLVKPLHKVFDLAFLAASRDSVVYDQLMDAFHMRMHPFWLITSFPRILIRCAFG